MYNREKQIKQLWFYKILKYKNQIMVKLKIIKNKKDFFNYLFF